MAKVWPVGHIITLKTHQIGVACLGRLTVTVNQIGYNYDIGLFVRLKRG